MNVPIQLKRYEKKKREIKHLQISILLFTFLLRIATLNNSLLVIALKKLKISHSVMHSENHL